MIASVSIIILIIAPLFTSAINTHGQFVNMKGKPNPASIEGGRWYTKSGPSLSHVSRRNTQSLRQGRQGYEDDVIPGDDQETVDLHKGEFCVDVSTFGPVEYDTAPVETCDSTFSKVCEDRYEEVINLLHSQIQLPWLLDILFYYEKSFLPILLDLHSKPHYPIIPHILYTLLPIPHVYPTISYYNNFLPTL